MKIIKCFSSSMKNASSQLAAQTMWLGRTVASTLCGGFSPRCLADLSTAQRRTARVALLLAIAVLVAPAQNVKQRALAQPTTQPSSPPPSTLPPLQVDSNAALHHLNQVISWYRRATTSIQAVGLPSDTIYEDNTKNLGAEVVRFAFQSAKAEAALIKAQQGSMQTLHESSQEQALEQAQSKTSSLIDQLQSQIDNLNGKIPHARPAQRPGLTSQRDALQSELDLQKALLDSIRKMTSFVEANGE